MFDHLLSVFRSLPVNIIDMILATIPQRCRLTAFACLRWLGSHLRLSVVQPVSADRCRRRLGRTVGGDDDVIRPSELVTAGHPFGGAQLMMVWVLVLIMRHGVVE